MNPEITKQYRLAYARITVLCLLALFCAAALVSVANDLYAFVKPNRTVTLSVETPLPVADLAARLEEIGVIQNPTVFRLYVRSKEKEALMEEFRGSISLRTDMSYREILLALSPDPS